MGDFRELKVWEKAHRLALAVYGCTEGFPAAERFGLTLQLRKAAASVPSKLAEGCGRNSDAELARYARISLGSTSEVEYQLLLARDLGYLGADVHQELANQTQEIRRMLASLVRTLAPPARTRPWTDG